MSPFVSVIIPVYGDAGCLDACLEHLARQTYPRERFETIMIDNGCPTIDRSIARHPEVQLVREARPGSFAARNAGLRIARGEVIAFTDADCLPHADWIARGVESLERSDSSGVLAGGIEIIAPRPSHVSPIAYLYSSVFSFRFQRAGGFGATANLVVRRAIIDAVGPFDPSLLSGGDMEWGRRAADLGFRTQYVPEVRVAHEARPSLRAILTRELRLAGGTQTNWQRRRATRGAPMIREIIDVEIRRHIRWALSELRSREIDADTAQRLQVGAVVVLAQVLRATERIRVFLGGVPRRA
jgi:glycosyltransferase involved in cell wall biosynthesis